MTDYSTNRREVIAGLAASTVKETPQEAHKRQWIEFMKHLQPLDPRIGLLFALGGVSIISGLNTPMSSTQEPTDDV